jgi:hypothetical protein
LSIHKKNIVNLFPIPFTHDGPSFSLVNKACVNGIEFIDEYHPNLLNAIDERHIVIETILVLILVVGRFKKLLHFLFHKVLIKLQAFRARANATQMIICKFVAN